jgi:gliding motility-associated lipoprotein GldJ
MVAIEGGSFTVGERGEFITASRDNKRRRITVSSFYMDQYEIRNIDWREYTNWMQKVFGKTAPKLVAKAQPNGKIWREELAYNEPYLENYFTHPSFDQYPIVGVTWEQAMDYCAWRTDRVNEKALIDAGIIETPDFGSLAKKEDFDSIATNFVFNTQKYLLQSSYKPAEGRRPKEDASGQVRKVDLSDGILFSDFRLPTEAEWEYAAKVSSQKNYISNFNNPKSGKNSSHPNASIVASDSPYPWSYNGNDGLRNNSTKSGKEGMFLANFKNGSGDYMGMTGYANDGAGFPGKVNSFLQNGTGLYNISGNVNEWVADIYRPMNSIDMDDFNPYRGNDVLDGDDAAVASYESGNTTTISNKSRVYKGGSWKDRPYWLNPGTRRYLDQDKSNSTIGFRCAVSAFGMDTPGAVDNAGSSSTPWYKRIFKK